MSLRTRLLLGVGLVLLLALGAADLVVRAELRKSLYQHIAQSLATSQRTVTRLLHPADHHEAPETKSDAGHEHDAAQDRTEHAASGSESSPGGFCNFVDVNLTSNTFVSVRTADGAVLGGQQCLAHIAGSSYRPALPLHFSGLGTTAGLNPSTVLFTTPASAASGPPFRVAASRFTSGPNGQVLLIGVPLTSTDRTLDQLVSIEMVVSAAALLLGVLLGWLIIHVDLRPLRDIERTAEEIAAGQLTSRVPGANERTEVGHVAAALNVMLGRIQDAFAARDATEAELRASEDRLRRFVGDASHELRTPIAAVSAYAELFEEGAATRPADLERAMGGIRRETARMGHLVEDLLLLARLDEGRPLERKRLELVGLAIEAVQTARAVGPQWPVRVQAGGPVEVVGDSLRLRQVIDNLLANVRAHTPPGTQATVRVAEEEATAVVEVADDGPGMSPEHASKIFDRFYRADPSRARSRGGSGLGLAIVSSIVQLHGGTVSVDSTPGVGTTFRVRLPAEPPEEDVEPDADGDGAAADVLTAAEDATAPGAGLSRAPGSGRTD